MKLEMNAATTRLCNAGEINGRGRGKGRLSKLRISARKERYGKEEREREEKVLYLRHGIARARPMRKKVVDRKTTSTLLRAFACVSRARDSPDNGGGDSLTGDLSLSDI